MSIYVRSSIQISDSIYTENRANLRTVLITVYKKLCFGCVKEALHFFTKNICLIGPKIDNNHFWGFYTFMSTSLLTLSMPYQEGYSW